MRIPPQEREALDYAFNCPHCNGLVRQSIVTILFAGDLFEPEPGFSRHLCHLCGGDFTPISKQVARDHMAKLQISEPDLRARLLEFFGGVDVPAVIAGAEKSLPETVPEQARGH